MKRGFLTIICIIIAHVTCGQIPERDSVLMNYVRTVNTGSNDFNQLFKIIIKPGTNDREKLTLFYYWVYNNLSYDIDGFIKNIDHKNINETLISRKGMCYEYDKLFEAACNELKIPQYSIEGYVKFYGFTEGQAFSDANHVWHAVYLDNKWLFADLLWASGNLYFRKDNYVFKRKLNTEYFLAAPASFLNTHLPLDPIWQFQTHPLTMDGFISKVSGVDSTQVGPYLNFADSIAKTGLLSSLDKRLATAIRAYNFNKTNPDILITTYYNAAVELVTKKTATKAELLHAKAYFTKSKELMSKTISPEVLRLAPECERGIAASDRRIKESKG